MRPFLPLALAVLSASPALAQQCTVPPQSAIGAPATTSPPVHEATGDALRRVTAAGARLAPQPAIHGYETGVAHTGQKLFVYFTPPDHGVVLGGTLVPVPYDTLLNLAGSRAHELAPYHHIRGMFLQNGERFQVLYDTPDHQAAVAGSLWDAAGKDITRDQIRAVPGAVPTIAIDTPETREATRAALNGMHGGEIGSASAPEATMLIDPQCMYSVRAIHALMPAVQAGRLRLRIVPLSLLDYEDRGESTSYAKAMLSFAPGDMASAWINGRLGSRVDTPVETASGQLAENGSLARRIGLKGTPTFLWTRRDGAVGRYEGNPPDVDAFIRGVGQ